MWKLRIVLATAALLAGCGSSGNGPTRVEQVLYGPGDHWIDEVRTGVLTFTARATVLVDLDGDDRADTEISVDGTTTVWRSGAFAGGPNPQHRDRIVLEIVDMRLEGDGTRLRSGDGIGNGRADGPLASIGSSVERCAEPWLADDLFGIKFEVDLGGGVLRNHVTLEVASTIEHLPPLGTRFALVGPAVDLFDEDDVRTGIRLVGVDYVVLERIE